jgi:mercuric ion transport protein
MTDTKLACAGAAGSIIAAICCFTPALALLLGAIGLSAWLAWLAWLDYVLLPALVFFLGLTGFALIRMQRAKTERSAAR